MSDRNIAFANNCPIRERDGDGRVVGRCWYYCQDGCTCPRHGDVSEALSLYRETGKLTDERQLPAGAAAADYLY